MVDLGFSDYPARNASKLVIHLRIKYDLRTLLKIEDYLSSTVQKSELSKVYLNSQINETSPRAVRFAKL